MSDIQQEKIFNAFSEKGKEFQFNIKPKNKLHSLLQALKLKPKKHTLLVKPIKYGVRGLCATYINKATFDKYANKTVFKAGSLFAEHDLDNVIMFLAIVLWNRNTKKPPEWLISCIKEMDQHEVDEVIEFAKLSLNTQSFLNSIISMTGVSLHPEEIIAPEKESPGLTK